MHTKRLADVCQDTNISCGCKGNDPVSSKHTLKHGDSFSRRKPMDLPLMGYERTTKLVTRWKRKGMPTLLTFTVNFLLCIHSIVAQNCDGHGSILTSSKGIIHDGKGPYPSKVSCEWLIRVPQKNQTVTLKFKALKTECEYDFLYIFDGASYKAPLLASISGYDMPTDIVSSSFEVLVVLQTDYAEKRDGFELAYEATDCPKNCAGFGTCQNGTCHCHAGRKAPFCEEEWCPSSCNQPSSRGNCDSVKERCACQPGFTGQSCSLPSNANADLNSWHKLSSRSPAFKPRSCHVMGYFKELDALYLFGGRSLNEVFGDVLIYNISTSTWLLAISMDTPVGRFHHAGDVYKEYLVIFGGETSNGTLLNDLWIFHSVSRTWSQPTGHNINNPPGVAGHTANVVGDKLYIFGGRLQSGGFSTDIYEFDFKSLVGWKKLFIRGGKSINYRFYGHSSVYHKGTHSLLIFGGEVAFSVGRNSLKQNKLVAFNLVHHFWTDLAPDNRSTNKPPLPMAFHSSVISGDYMIVYGGTVKAGHVEKCYSNGIYYYNTKCNMWVPASSIAVSSPASAISKPPQAGRISHASVLRDDQTMLVVGGFNGVVFGDVLAYRFPKAIAFKNSSGALLAGQHCDVYTEKTPCYADPSCGWCFDPLSCKALQDASSCIGLFDGSYCTSHCSAYSSCDSCLLFGNTSGENCSWCVHDRKCYSTAAPGGPCSKSRTNSYRGWWGSSSQLISNVEQCSSDNQPPGLTYTRYIEPVNFDLPDSVGILDNAKLDENGISPHNERYFLSGFLYPYVLDPDLTSTERYVKLSGVNYQVRLYLSKDHFESSKQEVAFLPFSSSIQDITAERKTSSILFPYPSRMAHYYLQCAINSTQRISNRKMEINWKLAALREHISFPYLRPYYNGNCKAHPTCMACIVDAACGWCSTNSSCVARASWSSCTGPESATSFVVTDQSMCPLCSDKYHCFDCVKNSFCSWSTRSRSCSRKGIEIPEITDASKCPSSCGTRQNCSTCLADDNCRWCEAKQECFPPSYHMLKYFHGQCHVYSIRINSLGDRQCRNCSSHTTCATCLADYRCGWCGTTDNPLVGSCHDGDFSGPTNDGNCSAITSFNGTVDWAYSRCPDVDECRLKIDDCHSNASCVNTDGSYNCICNRGFTGNGKSTCDKTCYYQCNHGYCGSDYQCKCDLGWKGINCSVDCLCNGHSTCNKGIGICDQCYNFTKGSHCDECVDGSYGDPKSITGCRLCNCNGHGAANKGICDKTTGKCFCEDHTTGDLCENCESGLSGDPRNGGICYHDCSSLTLIRNNTSGFLSSGFSTSSCFWIITASNATERQVMFSEYIVNQTALITLHFKYLDFSCLDSHLFVYDGVPGKTKAKLIAVVCGYDGKIVRPIVAKSGLLSVQYQGARFIPSKVMFYASFKVHVCNFSCTGNRHCVQIDKSFFRCICKPGWRGSDCKEEVCSSAGCNNGTGQGYCNEKTGRCICNPGFAGFNCSQPLVLSKFYMEDVSCYDNSIKPRFGQTFLMLGKDGNRALIYGGRNLESLVDSIVWSYDLQSKSCAKLQSINQPSGRYYHCGVIYKEKMVIYGGIISNDSAPNGLLFYDIINGTWSSAMQNENLPHLYAHSCTLVRDILYIIGGYNAKTGRINEAVLAINLTRSTWEQVKLKKFTMKGIFGHSAVYDEQTSNILVYGGIAFSVSSIRESNRLFALDLVRFSWNEIQPTGGQQPFGLYGHSATIIKDNMYIVGGYSDVANRGYNQDILLWRMRCNQWLKVSLKDISYLGHAFYVPSIWQSLISANESLYILGGFNSQPLQSVLKVSPPTDLCSIFKVKEECDALVGCAWCQVANTEGTCFDVNTTLPNNCSISNSSDVSRCTTDVLKNVNCTTFLSCSSCVALLPGTTRTHCRWCVKKGCLNPGESCNSYSTHQMDSCLNSACQAAYCETCIKEHGCMWTRYFDPISEIKLKYANESSRKFNWNCLRSSLELKDGEPKFIAKDKSPPNSCPVHCSSHTNCSSCLSSSGFEGGSKACLWSQKLNSCFAPSMKHLVCHTGECGRIFSNSSQQCPAICNTTYSCDQCLQKSGCGWCAKPGLLGEGVCTEGGLTGAKSGVCSRSSSNSYDYKWAPVVCPLEDECLNGRHNCTSLEICVDKAYGFSCVCKKGFKRDSNLGRCLPVCSKGCDHGSCIQPDLCQCYFGWTSSNCSVQCQCNGHSNCPNETHTDICIKCHNNTQGKHCEECKVEYVGDPSRNKACTSCSSHCNDRTPLCASKVALISIPNYAQENSTWLLTQLKSGPTNPDDMVCLNCKGNSEGNKCEDCIEGFFAKDHQCMQCQCNGHGSKCDKKTGAGCSCQHNTKSEGKDWSKQCNQCKSTNFYGSPVDGHQCFQRMTNEQALTIGNERVQVGSDLTIEAIPPQRSMFFAVPPRYTNVDIRLVVDVLQGGVDLYLSTVDNVFIVDVNFTSGDHTILSPMLHSRKKRSTLDVASMENGYPEMLFKEEVEEDLRVRRASSNISATSAPKVHPYVPKDKELSASADKLSMYTEYKGGLFLVEGIQRRVIVGIRYRYLDFSKDRFYVGVITRGNEHSQYSAGYIYFRQELSQIDLFVFFSVFFSVFFLILSLFFLLWKIKQLHHGRQAVIQQQIALVTMASRPFSAYTVQCERNESITAFAKVHSDLLEPPTSVRSRKNKRDRVLTLSPMAVEFTEDELAAIATVFIQFPENEESLWNLSLGSAILQSSPQQLLHIANNGNGTQKSTTRFLSTVAS